ncbi:hypothetical protein [Polaribacter sp. L3A8]|uniref:hypothetical protein n=1 Tax=Polaribacter sp. L3A8 TaxID=2686361 RepID=UPI00131A81BF|nr:hypothetical protein [Polaribacter sp. L3A8]
MKQLMYLLLFVVLFSCGNKKTETLKTDKEKPKLSIAKQHVALVNVKPTYEKEVENWQELKSVKAFIQKFEKVSPNEALSNALELRDLVVSLKDSVKPTLFDNKPFQTRVNVLHNEVLRLADLTFIPAITSEEVNLQVDKTITAFSSVNSKINSILAKKSFEDAIDIEIDYIGIDSTKIDSISKKSINIKRKEDSLEKSDRNKEIHREMKPITRE